MKYKGIVDWFNVELGQGFIKSDSLEESVYLHHNSIITEGFKYLNAGDNVEFEIYEGVHGLQALNVKKIAVMNGGI